MSAGSAISYARSYIGTRESPANSNRGPQIDKWQSMVSMGGQPWCGAFMFACLQHAGVHGLSSRMRYVPFIVEDARNGVNGLQRIVPWEDAKPGDLAIFQFDTGAVDHVGLLTDLEGSRCRTVEGNTSSDLAGSQSNGGMVAARVRARSLIWFIARPKYSDSPADPCAWPGVTLERGSRGSLVKHVQGWVNTLRAAGHEYNRLAVDGEYGPATEAAIRTYQRRHGLEVDGIVGARSWHALCKSVRAAK